MKGPPRKGEGGSFLGGGSTAGTYLLPWIIQRYLTHVRETSLHLTVDHAHVLYRRLEAGELDLLLSLHDPAASRRNRDVIATYKVPLRLVVNPRVFPHIDWKDAPWPQGLRLILPPPRTLLRRSLEEQAPELAGAGISMDQPEARKNAALAGMGATLLPPYAIQEEIRNRSLRVVPLPDGRELFYEFALVTAPDRRSDRTISSLVEYLTGELPKIFGNLRHLPAGEGMAVGEASLSASG